MATTCPTHPFETDRVPAGVHHDSAILATATWIEEQTHAGTGSPVWNAFASDCILSNGFTRLSFQDFAMSQL